MGLKAIAVFEYFRDKGEGGTLLARARDRLPAIPLSLHKMPALNTVRFHCPEAML